MKVLTLYLKKEPHNYLCHLDHFLRYFNVPLVVLPNFSNDEAGVVAPDHSPRTQLELKRHFLVVESKV